MPLRRSLLEGGERKKEIGQERPAQRIAIGKEVLPGLLIKSHVGVGFQSAVRYAGEEKEEGVSRTKKRDVCWNKKTGG